MNARNTKDTDSGALISRLDPRLPREFVSQKYDAAFLKVASGWFSQVLSRANSSGDDEWSRVMGYLRKFGLLELAVPRVAEIGPFELDIPGGKGESPSRRVVPRRTIDYGFHKVAFPVDRERIGEAGYLGETSVILAFLLAMRIFPGGTDVDRLTLLRVTATGFGAYMRDHHRGQLSVASIASFHTRQSIDQLTQDLPALDVFDRLGERLSTQLDQQARAAMEPVYRRLEERLDNEVGAEIAAAVEQALERLEMASEDHLADLGE